MQARAFDMGKMNSIQIVAVVCAGCAAFAGARGAQASSTSAMSASPDTSLPLASSDASGATGGSPTEPALSGLAHVSSGVSPVIAVPLAVGSDEAWSEGDRAGPRPGGITGFMGWAFNIPLGSARDFAKNASLLGFELQFNVWLTRELSLGVSGEWVTYVDNLPRSTFSVDEATFTATLYNQLQTTSVRLLAHYYMSSDAPFMPYVGPHVGASWSTFDLEAADLVLSDTQFSINLGAEAGIVIPFGGGGPSALVNLRYSTSPAADFRSIVSNVQSLGLLLGIGF